MMSRGLAHDLKNRITPVSSFLIHTDGHYPSSSPEAEVHSAARRSVKIMTDYVREALFFSERLAPHFEPVDLTILFRTVSEITAARAANRGIQLAFNVEPQLSLTADAVLLQRVFSNLVNNAIDASSHDQTVVVSASLLSSGKIRFQVKDEGCGIAPENLARIFDPYFTTKEFGDDVRGFGLGLTICQKIVQLHDGVIRVESQLQHGTTISVDLPQKPLTPVLGKATS
jgi:signal transduction histidine kinase